MKTKKKPKVTSFRIAGQDFILEDLMASEGLKASAIIRKALHFYANQGTALNIDLTTIFEELYALKLDLARIGGNLNQIARHFNTTEELIESELNKIVTEQRIKTKEVVGLLNKITAELGKFLNGKIPGTGNKPRKTGRKQKS